MTIKLTADQQAKHDEVMAIVRQYAYSSEEKLEIISTAIAQLCVQIVVNEEFQMLTDAQWTNIVNAHHAYEFWEKDDAVSAAVKLTEGQLQKNFKFLQSERDQLKAENERLKADIAILARDINTLLGINK